MARSCEGCGKEIPLARLAAVPSATLCVRCKSRRDDRPLRAMDVVEALAESGEITFGELQRMTQRNGG